MTREQLSNAYFEWMCRLVYNGRPYRKLLKHLHTLEFTYIIDMDSNRAEDGVDLRYRFGYEQKYDNCIIFEAMEEQPCSVLEMMISLAMRCEEHIMDDPDAGNRTNLWFWDMIANLSLESMRDMKFDMSYVDHVVSIFLNREYGRNGEGGLFTVENSRHDLQEVEIWYQMCWYLSERRGL